MGGGWGRKKQSIMKNLFLILATILGTQISQAQFLEKLADKAVDAAERTVERRVEKESSETTDEALDKVFEKDKKSKKQKKKNKKKKGSNDEASGSDSGTEDYTVKTAKDFVRGNKIIFQETFSNDAIGDFPGTWNTNGSGEVVTLGSGNTRWLKVVKGLYMPEGLTSIPDNSTLEMDIHQTTPYNINVCELKIMLVALNDKNTEFTTWKDGWGKDGVVIKMSPMDTHGGDISLRNQIDNKKVLQTEGSKTKEFSVGKNTVHLSIWRQGNRIRVYLDDTKVFDLPRAFAGKNYNTLIFESGATNEVPFYISNIVLASDAGADTRHKLLETGSFTTNDILFDSGKSTLQASSFSVLDEIGEVMKTNPSKHLTVIGHTDSDGSEQDNQKLSEQRAQSVKKYLVDKFSISSSSISTIGKGESQLVDSGSSSAAKAKNRRVEFTLK